MSKLHYLRPKLSIHRESPSSKIVFASLISWRIQNWKKSKVWVSGPFMKNTRGGKSHAPVPLPCDRVHNLNCKFCIGGHNLNLLVCDGVHDQGSKPVMEDTIYKMSLWWKTWSKHRGCDTQYKLNKQWGCDGGQDQWGCYRRFYLSKVKMEDSL
jgi:hypothetical protein